MRSRQLEGGDHQGAVLQLNTAIRGQLPVVYGKESESTRAYRPGAFCDWSVAVRTSDSSHNAVVSTQHQTLRLARPLTVDSHFQKCLRSHAQEMGGSSYENQVRCVSHRAQFLSIVLSYYHIIFRYAESPVHLSKAGISGSAGSDWRLAQQQGRWQRDLFVSNSHVIQW